MTNKHPCGHVGPFVDQRDYDDREQPLGEPDRSDDREQVIYEHEPPPGVGHPTDCPCWDCHKQLGPTARNH